MILALSSLAFYLLIVYAVENYMQELYIEKYLPSFLVNSKTYAVVVTDLEGFYTYVNSYFFDKFSFITNHFIGLHSFLTINPKDHEACLHSVQQCFVNSNAVVKVALRKPENHLNDFYWTSWEFSLLKDENQDILGVLCIGHDITETELASKRALEFSQKVETILDKMSDGFIQLDQELKLLKTNKVARDIFFPNQIEIYGNCILDILNKDLVSKYLAQFKNALHSNISLAFEDFHEETNHWLNIVIHPTSEGLSVFIRDVSQEKISQIELSKSEYKLKAILDSTTDGNLLINPEMKIISFNKTALNDFHFYYNSELKEQLDVRTFLPEENRKLFDIYFPLALKGQKSTVELEKEIDGKKLWFEVSYLPVYNANSQLIGVSKNTRDITVRKLEEIKIIKQMKLLGLLLGSNLMN
ncbi:PAS domain S-box protein [Pedobacter aquae]|uniref:PAS domain S-box protein n=1 Tax=Pedobacter aquae TaxID=2605747 RepID=A0A5C0VFQ7_9SPHI|nr:PAS domain S-box protein [Pedobacter aquae]QEK50877.1 PAS domain S-box protein [Pedobacter aquae]